MGATSKTRKEAADAMTTSSTTAPIAQAHGRFIRGSVSKVRRVLDQIRGRTYRDALIMLEFMPYRSTGPITKVLRSAVANAEHNLGLDPASLVISSASADMGPSMKRYRPRAQGRAYQIKKQTCHISIAVAAQTDSCPPRTLTQWDTKSTQPVCAWGSPRNTGYAGTPPARVIRPSFRRTIGFASSFTRNTVLPASATC